MLEPLSPSEFTRDRAAHLLNRAGFGGTPAEIDGLHGMGPEGAVDFLVEYERQTDSYADPSWNQPDPAEVEQFKALRQMPNGPEKQALRKQLYGVLDRRQLELHQWWLERMRTTPRPLQEKMTLFWHSLFATSQVKIKNPLLLWQQNDAFRRRAVGNWPDLLVAMAKDPAMLLWLDGSGSRKEAPNENFAREVMELFTLGEGHYTEEDIKQSARAYVGWHTDMATGVFRDGPRGRDTGAKTFLGRTGNFTGEEILNILAEEPRSAEYVWERLWRYFVSETPNPQASGALAAQFRRQDLEFKPALRTLFLSREFYAPEVVRNQVKGPVQWLVGSCRSLERPLPPALITRQMMRRLGQVLFSPPNVKGWDTGVSWISTNTLLDRYNFAALLVQGEPLGFGGNGGGKAGGDRLQKALARMEKQEMNGDADMAADNPRLAAIRAQLQPIDVPRLFGAGDLSGPDLLLAAIETRCMHAALPQDRLASLRAYVAAQDPSDPDTVRGAIRLLMSTPDYQLT